MTTIKASCPHCGDVELTSAQVRLVVCSIPQWSFYSFNCPHCSEEVRKPAANDVISLLQSGGVLAEEWHVPAEAMETHTGNVIDLDDVLDLVLDLNDESKDPFVELATFKPGTPAR